MTDDYFTGISGGFISQQDLKAARVCRQLQDWITSVEGTSTEPMVCLSITDGTTCIEIDRSTVWCSEADSDEDLTFEFCQRVFQDEILELTHYGRVTSEEPKPCSTSSDTSASPSTSAAPSA